MFARLNTSSPRANISPVLESRAKKIFGITKNPLQSGFITRQGRFIKLKEHKAIRVVFTTKQLRTLKNGNAIDKFTSNTGNLRIQVTRKQSAIEARRKLTPNQVEAIRKTQLNSNPIFFEFTGKDGKILKSGKFIDFSNFERFIRRNNLVS